MTQLLEIRTKIVEIYQKMEVYLVILFKVVLYFLAFSALKGKIGYNSRLSSLAIVLCLSAVSAFLPPSVVVAIMVIYIALQLYSSSVLIAATVLIIALILFCFFIRFASAYGNAVIAMPLLMGVKIPYVLPICLGLFSTPITIIPVCVGVFAYYFLQGVTANMVTVEQVTAAENPFGYYISVLDSVIKNEAMFASMIVFSLVIIAVYIVRNIKMDYSFEISIAVGAGTSMIGFIIMMLRYDVGIGVFNVCTFSILSGILALLTNYLYRPLFYAGTEQVQFEDDYYYYYVKAIPKIKVAGSKVNVRHVVSRRTSSLDEDFGDELDDVDSGLAINTESTLSGVRGRVLAGEPDDELDALSAMEYRAIGGADRTARRTGTLAGASGKQPASVGGTANTKSATRLRTLGTAQPSTRTRTSGSASSKKNAATNIKTSQGKGAASRSNAARADYSEGFTRKTDDSEDDF